MRRPVLAALVAIATTPLFASTPPTGFRDTVVMSNLDSPTAIAYEPGTQNLFVLQKGPKTGTTNQAEVMRRDHGTGTESVALTLSCVDPQGERGLLGIAFDPDYLLGPTNRHVYLYYTRQITATGACSIPGVAAGSKNRVSRFLESNGTLSGEQVLLEGPFLVAFNHNAGTVRFAPDKTLFISMGDNGTGGSANPASRDLGDLRGKILRIRRDGTIPPDNPFVGQPGKLPPIWAWGLRNPFRFSIDAQDGTPWIGDVGEDTYEELDRGVSGGDYGWPCIEGPHDFGTCNPPPANPIAPAFYYGHFPTQTPPVTGSSVTGGPVYRGGNFPADYAGNLFFGDYSDKWIRRAKIGAAGDLSNIQMFVPDAGNVVDIVQNPAGCLAWVDIGAGDVHEVCVTGSANGRPTAQSSAIGTAGLTPLDVPFTGSNSSDPDGDPLTYAWAFGDGGTSTIANPSHTYTNPGIYQCVLTVDDGTGAANSSDAAPAIRIVAGNDPPAPAVNVPTNNSHYDAGDTIAYAGSAIDTEDGVLPASAYAWTIVFHHDQHTHPFLGPINGVKSGSFVIPASGEDSTHVWYRIHLAATDSGAPLGAAGKLTVDTYVDVLPNVTTVTAAASPAGQGLQVTIDGTTAVAPLPLDTVVNFPRHLSAPSPQTASGRTWTFAHWADAPANARTVAAPATPTTYTALFRCTGNCAGLPDPDGDGFTAAAGDCDDSDPTTFPGAPDLCDGKNNDCLGVADDATCADFDGTGGVDGNDLALLGRFFGVCSPNPAGQPWRPVDYTKDGCIDGNDLAVMGAIWGCRGTEPICH